MKIKNTNNNITELSVEKFETIDELDQVLGDLFSNNKKLQSLDNPDAQGGFRRPLNS